MENLLTPYCADDLGRFHRVLVLAPHPDDEVFGCGATLARLAERGVRTEVVVLSDGGSAGDQATRRDETLRAAEVLGVGPARFLDWPDRGLRYGEALIACVAHEIDNVDADLVLAPSLWEVHPDHVAVALASLEAARRHGRCAVLHYEVGSPLRPNLLVDITAYAERKAAAAACFGSQLARQRYDEQIAGLNRYRSYTLGLGVRSAEAFELFEGERLESWARGDRAFLVREKLDAGYIDLDPDQMLVSVLIRSVDRDSLDDALRSVEAQSWSRLEIVVANAKGAGHRALPDRVGRIPLRLLDSATPRSRSDAANALLDHAAGDFCVFLDDDDLLLPGHVACLVAALRGDAGAVAAYGDIHVEGAGGEPAGRFGQPYDALRLQVGNYLPIHGVLFRRSASANGARFDAALDYCEDWDFWLQLARQGRFVYVPQTVGIYRTHAAQGFGLQHDPRRLLEVDVPVLRKALWQWSDETLYAIAQTAKRGFAADAALPLLETHGFADGELARRVGEALRELDSWRDAGARLRALAPEWRERLDPAELAAEIAAPLRLLRAGDDASAPLQQRARAAVDALHAVGELRAALLEHQNALRDTQARVAELLASRSWRASAPLRAATDAARRVKHRVGRSGRVGAWLVRRWDAWRGARLKSASAPAAAPAPRAAGEIVDVSLAAIAALPAQRRIGVHLHAYYPDLLDEFAAALACIDHPFELFVSVVDAAAQRRARTALKRLPRLRRLHVQIVGNRGRDIAPMLVNFAEPLSACDYVLHLHTKKSLYSGTQRDDWRGYLLRQLLGGREHVAGILSMFESDPALGIVYPQSFVEVPYVAHTWLANRAAGEAWCATLGIEAPRDAYFDVPVGSMFWARGAALQALWSHRWNAEDFPAEAGQTDGTTAHVVERLLVLAARARGFHHRIIADPAHPSWSPWRTDAYFARGIDETLARATRPEVQLVAFDIFDTLLTRPLLDAEAVKLVVAARVAPALREVYLNHRAGVERGARERLRRDVDLDAVYDEFVARGLFDAATAATLKALEADVERASLRPRADIVELLRRICAQGREVVLASDMFLPQHEIERALDAHGVRGWTRLYLSNVVQARKDSGDMYALILRERSLPEPALFMLGDNERSDVQIPMDRRMPQAHVMRAIDQARTLPRWRRLLDRVDRGDVHQQLLGGLLVTRFFGRGFAGDEVPGPEDFTLGGGAGIGYAAVGPMLAAFSLWLLERARADGRSRLLFLAREGELLKLVFDRIAAALDWGVETRYVELSRRCITVASIASLDDCRRIAAAAPYRRGPLREFVAARYGVQLDDAELDALRRSGAWDGAAVEVRDSAAHLDGVLRALEPRLLAQARIEREGLRAYLQALRPDAATDALVDVGYSGTIQDHLSSFTGQPLDGLYMMTTPRIRSVTQRHGSRAAGCFGEDLLPGQDGSAYWRYSFEIEQLLSSDEAQVTHYTVDESGRACVHRLALSAAERDARRPRAAIRQGAWDFIDDFIRVRRELLPGFTPPAGLAEAVFEAWVREPSPRERAALAALALDDHYCGRGVVGAS